jgi:hypothetical protein
LRGVLGGQTGWSRHFFDPIPTGDGGELRTLRDAGVYILAHLRSRAPKSLSAPLKGYGGSNPGEIQITRKILINQ